MSAYRLRDMTADELPRVLAWRNSARVRGSMFNRHTITLDEHRAWFERASEDPNVRLLVFEVDGVPTGVVNLTGLSAGDGKASWGFYVGADDPPKRTGTRMLALALDLVFSVPGVVSLESEVIEGNVASMKVHERLGFVSTGTGSHESDEGAVVSIIKYSLTRSCWEERRAHVVRELFEQTEGGTDDGQ